MNRIKALTVWLAALGLMLCAGIAGAELKAGKEYQMLEPSQPVESGAKIEVIEFFYYGCPHCYDAEPALAQWLKKLPADVQFRRIPAVFRDAWAPLAKTYYALEAMNELERLHKPVFDTIHLDGLALSQEKVMADYAGRNGIDRQKWLDTYRSFAVQTKVSRAKQILPNYKVTGVPAFIVDGKYVTSNIMAGDHDAIPSVLDQLIGKARQDRKKR